MEEKSAVTKGDLKDHLANERTFLAWIRTNLGIMAFGFVVEKFSFFIEQVASLLGKEVKMQSTTASTMHGYSFIFGITIVAIGSFLNLFSYIKYKRTERQIDQGAYASSLLLDLLLTLFVFGFGIFLIIYLIITFPHELKV